MTNESTTPENAISRRHFLLSASLATTALVLKPLTGTGAPARDSHPRADASGELCLWYDRPAETWMTEALPIGNGPMGAMLFGGTAIERVQFNEISLWSGTRMAVEGFDDEGRDLGAYRAFGDILIHLGHDFSKVAHYRQELDIDRAVHQVKYGKVRGWTVQTMNNACGVSYWKWNPPGSAWYAQHLWEHFAFGRDQAYLRKTAYPVLKEACQFWDDPLKRRPDGTLCPVSRRPDHSRSAR